MEGTYDAYLGTEAVGTVTVTREGLYYRFRCRCSLSGDVCKLRLTCGGREVTLGTLIPEGTDFCINTRVPVKHMQSGIPAFSVIPNKPVVAGKFIPICPEEPFTYLERLKDAYLEMRNGQIGAVLPWEGSK